MKVYLKGFKRPYAVVGTYVSEDERYLFLYDGDIRRRIPHDNIVHIEDFTEVVMESPAEEPVATQRETPKQPESPKEKFQALVNEKMRQRKSVNQGPAKALDEITVRRDVNIVISGAVERSLKLSIPESVIDDQKYTPALMKEIALNREIKAIMENGIIFDGVPTVSGDNIYINTKNLTETAGAKLGAATKLAGITQAAANIGKFAPPNKVFNTDFSMTTKRVDDFAIAGSPFDGPVPLDAGDEINENTTEEKASDQAEAQGGVPLL